MGNSNKKILSISIITFFPPFPELLMFWLVLDSALSHLRYEVTWNEKNQLHFSLNISKLSDGGRNDKNNEKYLYTLFSLSSDLLLRICISYLLNCR